MCACEMCGNFAGPDLTECEVDGARMLLCPKCAKFGTKISNKPIHVYEDEDQKEVTFVRSAPGGKGPSISHVKMGSGDRVPTPVKQRAKRDVLISDQVLIDDYGGVIQGARKMRGWSLEEFAQMINEKASLIQKIEKNEFNPSENLIVKIERKLEITLREEASAPIFTAITSPKETTLGDVVKLKKKKKD
ncbi:MAG: TIGR00270 family protein [Candidatus Heimdallarchaeota archaeon]|nr:TIGR00270 family protein [Candidatus Heimdallarchaeota archaeon]